MIASIADDVLFVAPPAEPTLIRLADIAHHWRNLTHDPEARARYELAALAERLNTLASTVTGFADDAAPGFDARFEIRRFSAAHLVHTRNFWAAEGRCASAFVVGPARFDVARHDKRRRWAEARRTALAAHPARALAAVKRRAYPFGAPGEAVRSADPAAAEKLEFRLGLVQAEHARRLKINAAWRKAGRPRATDDAGWARVTAEAGLAPGACDDARRTMALFGAWREAVAPYALDHLTVQARRLIARIADLRAMAAAGSCETDTGAVRIVENAEAARIQLVFSERPPEPVRAALRANGFRWAPSAGAWQRHLNNAGRAAAARMRAELEACSHE